MAPRLFCCYPETFMSLEGLAVMLTISCILLLFSVYIFVSKINQDDDIKIMTMTGVV